MLTPDKEVLLELPNSSLLWGTRAGSGDAVEHASPADSSLIATTRLLSDEELQAVVHPQAPLPPISAGEMRAFCERLHAVMQSCREEMLCCLRVETAFSRRDCEEVLEGTLFYAHEFPHRVRARPEEAFPYESSCGTRRARLARAPWGTIAVILPQSAFFVIGVTTLLNALAAGNRAILRAPAQRPRSAVLLSEMLQAAEVPHNAVSVALCRAKEFAQALSASPAPALVHYLGSSRSAASLLGETFSSGKGAIVDGEGNTWVYVGHDADPSRAAHVLAEGATRYNGQTCTSIVGAIVHPEVYDEVRAQLVARLQAFKVGNPLTTGADIGPLMDAKQAAWCQERIEASGGRVLCGERDGTYLKPALVENPDWSSELVTHGIFGPALWLRRGEADQFVACWPRNQFPLCAGVLSPSAQASWWLARLGNLSRLSLNGDPSVEDPFEPWGGYPSTGVNPVSSWLEKYQRVVAVDEAESV